MEETGSPFLIDFCMMLVEEIILGSWGSFFFGSWESFFVFGILVWVNKRTWIHVHGFGSWLMFLRYLTRPEYTRHVYLGYSLPLMLAKTLASLKILCPSDPHEMNARTKLAVWICYASFFGFQRASTWSKPKCHLKEPKVSLDQTYMWHMQRKQQGPFQSAENHGAVLCHAGIIMGCISKVCDEILYNYIILAWLFYRILVHQFGG